MALSTSRIEYVLNPDGTRGKLWPIITGCNQPLEVCATRATCWARLAHHMRKEAWARNYNQDFSPRFNPGLIYEPLFRTQPTTFAVGFTGDAFGPGTKAEWIEEILEIVKSTQIHRYLFLTKSPERLAQFNWPDNAWVGMSITGVESFSRQRNMWDALHDTEARNRWVSYEPLLSEVALFHPHIKFLRWAVIGAQGGPRAVKPRLEWVRDIIEAADRAGVKIWLKNSLLKMFPSLPKRQELPC